MKHSAENFSFDETIHLQLRARDLEHWSPQETSGQSADNSLRSTELTRQLTKPGNWVLLHAQQEN